MKAEQKEDSETKLLQVVSDISIEQRSSYLPSLQHMAFDGQGNNCFQGALSHPTVQKKKKKQTYKLVPQTSNQSPKKKTQTLYSSQLTQ